jgi:hypothetical protein
MNMETLTDEDRYICEAVLLKAARSLPAGLEEEITADMYGAARHKNDDAIATLMEWFMGELSGVPYMACTRLYFLYFAHIRGNEHGMVRG